MGVFYCKKCGKIIETYRKEEYCSCCQSIMYAVPQEYLWNGLDVIVREGEKRVIEELVKTSPEFDQYLFDHREEIIDQKVADYNARMADAEALIAKHNKKGLSSISSVTCPYCNSTNTQKITVTAKAVNTAVFGIFGTKRFKQWHCNKCGSDF